MTNLSFIHRAMKDKDPEEFDINEKHRIINLLRVAFGLHGLTGQVLFFNKETMFCQGNQPNGTKDAIFKKYFVHAPDVLIIGLTYKIVVEIDGPVHWQNAKAVKATNARNEHYDLGKVKNLWFTRDQVKNDSSPVLVGKLAEKLGMEPRMEV